jgi:multiple sugar transport system substrate-binding protein
MANNKNQETHRLSSRHSRRNVVKAGAAGLALPALGASSAHAASSNAKWSSVSMHLRRQGSIKLQASVWLGDAEFKAMQELAARYIETHPEVEIEFVNIVEGGPWGRDQLQRMIAGGEPPDLMMLNTGQFEAFGTRGALAEIDERISGDSFDLGIYFEPAVNGCKIDGKLYGLPKDISDHVVYLNTDFFEEAGVELPTNDWTWDDYREIAKALTRDTDGDGQVDRWGTAIQNSVWSWGSYVHSNGGGVLNDDRTEILLDTEEAREALRAYYGVMTEDEAAVPPGALPQVEGASEQFLSALIGMNMAGPWFRPGLVENKPFNWTLRLYPRPTEGGDPPISVLYTDQWAMSSASKNPDEAWELLKFLGGSEGQTLWSEIYGSRSITPIQELANSDAWLGYGGPEHREDNQTILDQLERTVPPPTNFGNGAEIENIWNEQFELVMVGQQDVDMAVDTIVQSASSVLQGP